MILHVGFLVWPEALTHSLKLLLPPFDLYFDSLLSSWRNVFPFMILTFEISESFLSDAFSNFDSLYLYFQRCVFAAWNLLAFLNPLKGKVKQHIVVNFFYLFSKQITTSCVSWLAWFYEWRVRSWYCCQVNCWLLLSFYCQLSICHASSERRNSPCRATWWCGRVDPRASRFFNLVPGPKYW